MISLLYQKKDVRPQMRKKLEILVLTSTALIILFYFDQNGHKSFFLIQNDNIN